MAEELETCGICGVDAEPLLLQMCFRCDTQYHLNPYSNREGIDCGDAIIGPELGVYYYCAPCLVAINDEINALVLQETQAQEMERRPGWVAPGMAASMPSAEAPAPTPPPARSAPPRPAGSPPRRRFRRID
ncbi:MAG: hypothetical protein AB7G21_06945 [Dehalococcoidia bacterium]